MGVLFGWPVYNDASPLSSPVYQGGSWVAGLPLTNLSRRELWKVARSSSLAVADTQFQAVFLNLTTTPIVGLISFPKHTLSAAATLRMRITNGNVSVNAFQRFLDFSTGWTSVGTPTRVAANVTGTDGVPLDLIGDDAAGALEGYTRVLGNLGTTGQVKVFEIVVAAGGSSTSLVVRIRDTTAPADRLLAVINPNAAPPTPTMTTGTHVSTTLRGGQYRILVATTVLTTANAHQLEVYPASNAALTTTLTGTANVGDIAVQDIFSDRVTYDSGYVSVPPAGQTLNDLAGFNSAFTVLPANVLGNMLTCEIRDTTNPAGFIDLSRLIVAGAFRPTYNFAWGAGITVEDTSEREESDGLSPLYTVRGKRRRAAGAFAFMPENEAMVTWLRMQLQLGITGQLFFMWNDADTTYKNLRSFLAVFAKLDALQHPELAGFSNTFELVEET